MKTLNIGRGLKLHTGTWDDAFILCRGQQFNRKTALPEDEADYAIKMCEDGATPMQAAIEMYGQPRGKFVDRTRGSAPQRPELIFDRETIMEELARRKRNNH